jgi:hypothetical protein
MSMEILKFKTNNMDEFHAGELTTPVTAELDSGGNIIRINYDNNNLYLNNNDELIVVGINIQDPIKVVCKVNGEKIIYSVSELIAKDKTLVLKKSQSQVSGKENYEPTSLEQKDRNSIIDLLFRIISMECKTYVSDNDHAYYVFVLKKFYEYYMENGDESRANYMLWFATKNMKWSHFIIIFEKYLDFVNIDNHDYIVTNEVILDMIKKDKFVVSEYNKSKIVSECNELIKTHDVKFAPIKKEWEDGLSKISTDGIQKYAQLMNLAMKLESSHKKELEYRFRYITRKNVETIIKLCEIYYFFLEESILTVKEYKHMLKLLQEHVNKLDKLDINQIKLYFSGDAKEKDGKIDSLHFNAAKILDSIIENSSPIVPPF